jgi:hypothetical protein
VTVSSIKPEADIATRTLRLLHLVDRNEPLTDLVAKKVIEIGQSGVRDPAEIAKPIR